QRGKERFLFARVVKAAREEPEEAQEGGAVFCIARLERRERPQRSDDALDEHVLAAELVDQLHVPDDNADQSARRRARCSTDLRKPSSPSAAFASSSAVSARRASSFRPCMAS